MKYVIKSLIFIAFCLFLGQIIACKPPNELLEIGNQLMQIDSIFDFSTNHNKPVPKIENIGENLYKLLRKGRNLPTSITSTTGDFPNQNGADYILWLHPQNHSTIGIRLKKKKEIYAIIGYSGGYDW